MSETLKKINVFLIKKDVTNLADIIKFKSDDPANPNPRRVELDHIENLGDGDGAFYIGDSNQKDPDWLEFVNQLAKEPQTLEKNTTNSAVLVLKVEERLFAFTFGYGRFFVDMAMVERGFGLKVALNVIDPTLLRTMDYNKYEEVVVNTRRQVSRGSSQRIFEIDIDTEFLRNIGGRVKEDEDLASSVNGSDAVIINLKDSVGKTNIVGVCSRLLELYQEDDYKEAFDWVDHILTINDTARIETLDMRLLDVIKDKQFEDFHMAPPGIINWEDFDGITFSTAPDDADPKLDPEAEDYIDSLEELTNLTVEDLKKHAVKVKSTDTGEWKNEWAVYECIVFETTIGNDYFVLHEGKWFQMEKKFADKLNQDIDNISKPEIDLPDAPPEEDDEVFNRFSEDNDRIKTHHEGYYNEYVGCKNDDMITLDRRNVKPTDSSSPIEFCDILRLKKEEEDGSSVQFVHVKPGTSSSKLSHLFKQGSVSAELFLGDGKLRDRVKEIIKNDPIFENLDHWTDDDKKAERDLNKREKLAGLIPKSDKKVDRDKYEVVYCIISNKPDIGWPQNLPFFSKVSLRKEKRNIERMGLKVSLIKVKDNK